MQRSFGGAAGAAGKQILDGATGLQTHGGVVLPPADGAPLGVHEPLLEDVIEDIFEVEQLRGVADVDELRGHLLVDTRSLMVRDPKLGRRALGDAGRHVGSVE